MISDTLTAALTTLAEVVGNDPQLEEALRARWRVVEHADDALSEEQRQAADLLDVELPPLTQTDDGVAALGELLDGDGGPVLLSWCSAAAWRRDAWLAPVLRAAARVDALRERVTGVASERVVGGPLYDALGCAPLLGDGSELSSPSSGAHPSAS